MAMRIPHLTSWQSKRKAHWLLYLKTSLAPKEEEEEFFDRQANDVKSKRKDWFGLLEDCFLLPPTKQLRSASFQSNHPYASNGCVPDLNRKGKTNTSI